MNKILTNASQHSICAVLGWRRYRWLIVVIPFCLLDITGLGITGLGITGLSPTYAAPPSNGADKPATQEKNANLTEGLLDLLNEPAPKPSRQTEPSSVTPPASPSPSKPIEPEPIGSEKRSNSQRMTPRSDIGEDLGQGPGNPLSDVQLSMKTAAGWLKANRTLNDTRQLQKDIVSRLDDLISDLDQQSSKQRSSSNEPAPSSNSKQSQSTEQTQSQARSSTDSKQPTASDASQDGEQSQGVAKSDPSQPGGSNSQPSGPNSGNPGQGPLGKQGAQVDLKDPQALVRSAWGKLPERVREQMQSRMVERFLPKYREEIEAYYRALAK